MFCKFNFLEFYYQEKKNLKPQSSYHNPANIFPVLSSNFIFFVFCFLLALIKKYCLSNCLFNFFILLTSFLCE